VVEGSYYTQRQPHLSIETDTGFAYFDKEGRLTIHSKSIGLYLHLYMIAPGIGLAPEKIHMVQSYAGGTFGYKFLSNHGSSAGRCVMATNRPVSLTYDYQQYMQYTGKRSPFFTDVKMAADAKGKIVALESNWICDHGPYSEFGDLLTLRGAQYAAAGYDIANMRGLGKTVCTNHVWGAASAVTVLLKQNSLPNVPLMN
jgi:aldehyde oxidoreductase